MSAIDRVNAMRDRQAEADALEAGMHACLAVMEGEGWSDDERRELKRVLKVDLTEGEGCPRLIPLLLAERRYLWRAWFGEMTDAGNAAAGINQRIREAIKNKKESKASNV